MSWNNLFISQRTSPLVTLHVSVWVEMHGMQCKSKNYKSRSTWACELKSVEFVSVLMIIRHAPRERVSWNKDKQAKQQRVFPSRSTWACELKYSRKPPFPERLSHAPRERVSWNISSMVLIQLLMVTLHVSVWVEISNHRHYGCDVVVTLHVSVWVEMKTLLIWVSRFWSRSTWACELKLLA